MWSAGGNFRIRIVTMPTHTDIINQVIQTKGFTSYLEIGLHKRENNFDRIKCRFKISVDPKPECMASFTGGSDEFFQYIQEYLVVGGYGDYGIKFDCIFIDGLHEYEQVKRDFINAMDCLNDGGIILIHDTNPEKEEYCTVPRMRAGRWNGDVFRLLPALTAYKVDWVTIDYEANGLTVIRRNNEYHQAQPSLESFNDFKKRPELLRLVNKQQFAQWLTT